MWPKSILTLLFFIFIGNANSQVLKWANKAGAGANDNGNRCVADKFGSLYVTGSIRGSGIDFDPGPGTFLLSSAGLKDGFVAKYDSSGKFRWAFKIGGTSEDEVGDIALDSLGNIVVTGYFRGNGVDFDPSANAALFNSNGDNGGDPGFGGDMFVAKYDTAGNYKWAFNVGGTQLGDNGTGICTDKNNNIFVSGYFRTVVDFDPSPTGTFNLDQANGTFYLAKYNATGQFQWALNAGQGGATDNTGFDVSTDNANNAIVTGFFQGTNIDFDPSAATNALSSAGGYDFFVAKYSPTGQYLWAKRAGGSGSDIGWSVVADANNDVYVSGNFNSATINFNGGVAANNISNKGGDDLFLVKYSATGQHLWSFGAGGGGGEYCFGATKDDAENIVVTGAFTESNVDFDPSPNVINLASSGGNDIYCVKYSPAGNFLCSFRVGGPNNDIGKGIACLGNYTYVTGVFDGANVDFDPTAGTTLLTSVAEDAFFAKYDWTIIPPAGTITGTSNCVTGITQLTFTAASGAGPFTLYINNGSTTTTYPNIQSGVPFTIPTPGAATTYTLTSIKDANLCSAVTPAASSVVLSPNGLPIVTSGNAGICKLDSVQLTASGGTAYQWSPAAGLSNPSIANPKASPAVTTTYKVVVTNSTGCKDSATLTVTIKPAPTISVLPAAANFCNGDSVQFLASGGTVYQWSPAMGLSNAAIANPKASPAATTTYKLVVTNADGCKDSVTKTVTKNPSPLATALAAAAICPGDSTQLSATGGTNYQWVPATGLSSSSIAAPKASPAATTLYKVVVTDANGCRDSATVTVSLKPKPILVVSTAPPICKGDSAQLTALGAVSYQWTPAVGLSNPSVANPKASPLATTAYQVTGMGSNGCRDTASIVVTVNNPPVISLTANTSVCAGDSVQLNAGGGATYQWSPATGLSSPTSATPKASPATTTTYKVKVYSAAACVDSATVTVAVKPKPVVTVTSPTTICNGDTLQLNASGGITGGISYQWSPSAGLSNAMSPAPFASPAVTTNYSVTVTNSDGCKDSAQTLISVTPKDSLRLGKDTAICENEDLLLDGTLPNGVDYLWNTGATSPSITVDQPGTYSLLVQVSGCSSPAKDTIVVNPLASPVVTLGGDTTICSSYTLQLKANARGADSYLWSTGSRDSFILVNNAGTYYVVAANKCDDDTASVTITVDVCSDDLFFPTAFTPNGDRKNDVYKAGYVQGFQVFDYELQIFNRWGQRVFMTNEVTKGWDGRIAGVPQGNGVFVWLAKYRKSQGGALLMRKGTAALIR